MKRLFLMFLFCILGSVSFAKDSFLLSNAAWYGFFQTNGQAIFQNGGGYSVAPQISWNPTFVLSRRTGLKGSMGGSALNNTENTKLFLSNHEALFVLSLDGGYLEIGGGVQLLYGSGTKILPLASGNIAWPLRSSLFPLERLFVGYSLSVLDRSPLHQGRVGIGLTF